MPMFEYTARNPSGQIQKGQLDVQTKDEVSAYLRKNRLILVSVREAPKQIYPTFAAALAKRSFDPLGPLARVGGGACVRYNRTWL